MTRTELVGPLPTIYFHDGSRLAYSPPRDTRDNRYAACRRHWPACDCREAELAECLAEHATAQRRVRRVAARLLVGHRAHDYGELDRRSREEIGEELWWRYLAGDGPLACQCTGCQLARAGDVRVWTDDDGIVTADAEDYVG